MAVPLGPSPAPLPAGVPSRGVVSRKIGMLGSNGATLHHAPWQDPSWELWGHASSVSWYRRPLERYFDLHDKTRWSMNVKKKGNYVRWLGRNTVPIYMQERYPEVPASIRYPKERILMEYGQPRAYFTNHLAWMMALAFSEGVTTIGLFGINYGHETEYATQRGCAEYWLGRAAERGIHLVIPEACTLLAEPKSLYGYDSHDEKGTLKAEYQPREIPLPKLPTDMPAIPPEEIRQEMTEEELERPDWAKQWRESFADLIPQAAQNAAITAASKGNGHG